MTAASTDELFVPVANARVLHPSFLASASGSHHQGAREVMQRTFEEWEGSDVQFVRDFQTVGFDARVWELYLAATLNRLGWAVSSEGGRPDFKCQQGDHLVYVEAGTANARGNPPRPSTRDEFFDALRESTDNRDEVAVRFGSILRSKINKQYQNLEHVAGNPLVIAVQGFFDAGSLFQNELPLVRYLYGQNLTRVNDRGQIAVDAGTLELHEGDSKTIESGLFDQAEATDISAVLWSNSGTVPKFNRQAELLGLGAPDWEIHRYGTELDPRRGASDRAVFVERVGAQPEPWEEGLVLMHNPHATNPLDGGLFLGVTQIRFDGTSMEIDFEGRKTFSQISIPHPIANREQVLRFIRTALGAAGATAQE